MKKTPCLMLKQLNVRAALASVSMGMDANERRSLASARVGASCSYFSQMWLAHMAASIQQKAGLAAPVFNRCIIVS